MLVVVNIKGVTNMCTLMEKDVLIEEVSATAAFIAYRTPSNTKSEDLIECSEIRENWVCTKNLIKFFK